MANPAPSLQTLARKLVALEEARGTKPNNPHGPLAARVCQTLGDALKRFAGPDGFASLLRRAVALASADAPSLRNVKVTADGRLDGLEADAAGTSPAGVQAAVAITAHLLALLVTFIGESLALRLVREAWPDASLDDETSIGETDS